MINQQTTLRDVLTQRKPNVLYNCPPLKESRNTHWPHLEHSVTIWSDFNLTNLNESYGSILDLPLPGEFQLPPAPSQVIAGVSISATTDIRHLTCWNDQIIPPTVDFARRKLGIEPGIGLDHTASTADSEVLAKLPVSKSPTVDHIIMLDDFQPLVIGMGRATQWSARKLIRQLPNPTKELLWPVRQLAKLCELGQIRYGYIQTKEELVVCRLSLRDGPGDKKWNMAIQPIPWARNGCDALTTDLALWWLCMLGISGQHHRAITREEDMVSIAAWDTVYLDEERGWARRHRYSKIEVPTSPPSPPAYEIATSGDVTALETEIGLNAGDNFDIEGSNIQNILQAGADDNEVDLDSDLHFDFDANFISPHIIANLDERQR